MKELALLQACRAGASDVVLEVLLEDAGLVAVESEGKKRTPLLIAARAGRRDVVELLLGRGAHGGRLASPRRVPLVDHQDVDGKTALQLAAFQGDAAVVALLLAAGADALLADHRGLTPLHIGAWQGHLAVVSLILDFHASSPSATPASSSPPPQEGQQAQQGKGAAARRRMGPFGDYVDDDNNEEEASSPSSPSSSSLLAAASVRRPPDAPASPASSVSYRSVVDAVDGRGRSALYLAAYYEQEAVVQLLLGAGANPMLATSGSAGGGGQEGKRPLHRAIATGNKGIIAMLLEAEREPQRALAMARLRQQQPPHAPTPGAGEEQEEDEADGDDHVVKVGLAAVERLPDDLLGELVDMICPSWF